MRSYAVTQALQTALTGNAFLWAKVTTVTGATLTPSKHVSIVTRDELIDIIELEAKQEHIHIYIMLPDVNPTMDFEHSTCNNHILNYRIAVVMEASDANMEYIQEYTDYTINALKQSSSQMSAGEPVVFEGAAFYRTKPQSNIISALINIRVENQFKITS